MNAPSSLEQGALRRILVVDDDVSIHALAERAASTLDLPVEIEFARSAVDAYDWIAGSRAYDLVLADFMFEDPPCGLVLRERCQAVLPSCVFALMSSMPLHAPGVPEQDFLKKPFSVVECRDFIAGHLGDPA